MNINDVLYMTLFVSVCLSQVAQLLYGFLIQKNNSWFRSLLPPEVTKKGDNSILSETVCVYTPFSHI